MPEFSVDWFHDQNRPAVWKTVFGHLCGRPRLRVLEVGCYEGRATMWMLSQLASHETSRIMCVDSWRGGFNPQHDDKRMREVEARYDANLAETGQAHRVTKLKADSTAGMANLIGTGQKFDVVYVDACHKPAQATADIVMGWHLTYPGGYLIIDDYASKHENHAGLKQATDTWVKEFGEAVHVCHRGYQLIVRKDTPEVEQHLPGTAEPVFYCQVYQDPERLDWCLEKFRKAYPTARCYIISDGDDASPWAAICERYECEYHPGERLKLLEYGGQMLQRNLSIFDEAPGTHLVKFDTDTAWHRPFNFLPKRMGMYGTVQFNDAPPGTPRIRSIQGGCYVWTASAVHRLLDSGILLEPRWSDPAEWGGNIGQTSHYVKRTGLISEDWLLGTVCPLVGVPVRQFNEVQCVWRGDTNWRARRYAATHPHKDTPKMEYLK